jgi:hypothetical protein
MTTQNKALIFNILRGLPRVWLAVCLQGLGALVVTFTAALLLPGQKGLPGLAVIIYIIWSSRRLDRYLTRS